MERRPIASRETRWAHSLAAAIAKTGITPNAISVLGTFFALAAGLLIVIGWAMRDASDVAAENRAFV